MEILLLGTFTPETIRSPERIRPGKFVPGISVLNSIRSLELSFIASTCDSFTPLASTVLCFALSFILLYCTSTHILLVDGGA